MQTEFDFDENEKYDKKNYQVTEQGLHNYQDVGIADGNSTEFLMTYCFAKL